MIVIVIVGALLGAVLVAGLIVKRFAEPPPKQQYCPYCKRMTHWRPEIGCELCHEADGR